MPEETEKLTAMVAEIMQANIKLTEEKTVLSERLDKTERALSKLIGEFERHSHNSLGMAVVPVS